MIVLGHLPSGALVAWDDGDLHWLVSMSPQERRKVERAFTQPILRITGATADGTRLGRMEQPGSREHAEEVLYSLGGEVAAFNAQEGAPR